MKTQKLIGIAAIVCFLVGASGPAQAQDPEEDALAIITFFCDKLAVDAEETLDKLADADEDLELCVDDFRGCRDGGPFGDDPLVECLISGYECLSRAGADKVGACSEFKLEFADLYSLALRQARRKGVEDEVQDFFNSRGQDRFVCLRPAIQVGRVCSDNIATTEPVTSPSQGR